MEPVSAIATGYAAHRLLDVAEAAIRRHVIEPWSKRRAREFFSAFCQALTQRGISPEELSTHLDVLLSNQTNSEVMFDAYRSVCLTKSRVLGPRIIALLTAKLVTANSRANDSEELIFAAAEELSDSEFEAMSDFVLSHRPKHIAGTDDTKQETTNSFEIQVHEHTTTSNWPTREPIALGPLNLASDIGTWASKLKRLGLVSDDVRERQWSYGEDSEQHIDEPGVARQITWWIRLDDAAIGLAELVRVATPMIID